MDENLFNDNSRSDDLTQISLFDRIKMTARDLTSKPQMEKFHRIRKRVFPHLSTEVATVLSLLAVVGLAAGMISTATIGQEREFMLLNQSIHKPIDENTEETQEAEFEIISTEPGITTQTIEYQTSQMCFIGDSRTVFMEGAVLTDVHFIAKSSMGLAWFNDTASVEFKKIKNDVGMCVVALGINDIFNVESYIVRLNEFAAEYPDKTFIYVNLGPVDESKYTGIPNSKLEAFNKRMQEGLSDRWQIVDQYTYLAAEGFSSDDGLHYSYQDSAKVFAWIVDSIKTQTITVAN